MGLRVDHTDVVATWRNRDGTMGGMTKDGRNVRQEGQIWVREYPGLDLPPPTTRNAHDED